MSSLAYCHFFPATPYAKVSPIAMHLLKVLSDCFFDQSMAFHYNKISEAGNFLKEKKEMFIIHRSPDSST